jgi:4-amino-4-deoxy-L-arabinose transferase-like glycosyltransferase
MRGLKNSGSSLRFNPSWAAAALLLLAALSLDISTVKGWSMAYGDAEAHLNIARRITDSRTPGPSQIGTVWLPLPHLLMMPFAAIDALWFSGLAGSIPVLCCFLLAAVLLYRMAGLAASLVFALNLNMLYLATTPMTEPIMAAALTGLLYATLRYREAPSTRGLLAIAALSNLATLTRYEGWALIPVVALFIWHEGGFKRAVSFGALAAIAPIAWLAHNQFYYDDPLAFYRGPYSSIAQTARQHAEGLPPGAAGNWVLALRYFGYALRDVLRMPILIAAAAGAVVLIRRRQFWPLILLAIPGLFDLWSIHSGGAPFYVRELEPYTWFNARFALEMLPLAAFAIAALPKPAVVLTAVATVVSLFMSFDLPVFEESQLVQHVKVPELGSYRRGAGIIFRFGDLAAVFRASRIHLREGLYQDNLPQWNEALGNPQVFQREEWALAEEGDEVDQAIHRQGDAYKLIDKFYVKGKPAILVYRRSRQ